MHGIRPVATGDYGATVSAARARPIPRHFPNPRHCKHPKNHKLVIRDCENRVDWMLAPS